MSSPVINWDQAAPNPECLLILPWPRKGVIVAWRDRSKTVHGCRYVSYGPYFDMTLRAWIEDARRRGLGVEITARRAKYLED
jgi:hypothetical protein